MIDEAGESFGARYPISAPDGRYEERPCDADPADFDVQQRPGVLDVQAVRNSKKNMLPETHLSEHLSPHSSKVSATYTDGPQVTVSYPSYHLRPGTEQPEAAYGPSASRVAEGNGASSSQGGLHHEDQVRYASPAQHVRPVVRD